MIEIAVYWTQLAAKAANRSSDAEQGRYRVEANNPSLSLE
jgi:hypothetical protein